MVMLTTARHVNGQSSLIIYFLQYFDFQAFIRYKSLKLYIFIPDEDSR